jgi:hypothetical protein
VLEFVTEQMRKDPAYISLTEKMLEMSESENLAGFKKLEAEAEIMYKAYLKSLVTMFPDIFGEQEYLKDLIARAQAGTPFAGATRLPRNTPVTPLDNPPPTGP